MLRARKSYFFFLPPTTEPFSFGGFSKNACRDSTLSPIFFFFFCLKVFSSLVGIKLHTFPFLHSLYFFQIFYGLDRNVWRELSASLSRSSGFSHRFAFFHLEVEIEDEGNTMKFCINLSFGICLLKLNNLLKRRMIDCQKISTHSFFISFFFFL